MRRFPGLSSLTTVVLVEIMSLRRVPNGTKPADEEVTSVS